MTEKMQFLAHSRSHFKEMELFHKQVKELYGDNIPQDFLEQLTSEIKIFRLKYNEEASRLNSPRNDYFA